MKEMKIVVTGGAGFIGSHLVEKLLALGARVTVIDNFLSASKIEHLREHRNLTIYEGDVRDAEVVLQALKDKDLVFHLAAVVGVEETQMMPSDVLDVEIRGTINVLTWAANYGVKRVIFASSSEVYGDLPNPMDEEGPVSPKSSYAVAKLTGEEYCKAFYQKYGLEHTCLRYFNVYGPRQDERFVIPRFVSRMLHHEPILIYGDGSQSRDFTYVDDAVSMTLLAGTKPETSCKVINVGTGIMVSINEVGDMIAKVVGRENHATPIYVDYDDKRPRTVEALTRCADITRARQLLQYEPKVSLESGITQYVDWYLWR